MKQITKNVILFQIMAYRQSYLSVPIFVWTHECNLPVTSTSVLCSSDLNKKEPLRKKTWKLFYVFFFFCWQAFTDHGCKQINLDMGSINVKEGQRRVMNTSLKYPEYVYVMHFELFLVKLLNNTNSISHS
jgi:hypothetical protein